MSILDVHCVSKNWTPTINVANSQRLLITFGTETDLIQL